MNNEKLLSLLTLQLTHVKQLDKLLNDETQSLVERDHELIASLAQSKQHLMQQLETIDVELSSYAEQIPQSESALALKDEITDLLAQCHTKNLANGKAIELSINSIERLQGALIQKRSGNAMTYNAKGKTRAGSASSGYISA
ncbi:flagellar protein FlgN [Psychrobium sp. MM17-31]|jgi:flagella synthesis protein FlgN|uniref:flagella synthesis protein FlgN n=1 Tax=Psychrobium sp. MM17-31 TaxID=2917758 RepID=UPI001EF4B5CE|nr:flagellar protein FlgN [Psychrobium sp. MM17-31]MCG7530139.1 flagellar protein FlgN [Psychrobium sp. MM17-31]